MDDYQGLTQDPRLVVAANFVRAHPHEKFDGDRARGVGQRDGVKRSSMGRGRRAAGEDGDPRRVAPPRVDPTPD